MDAGPKCRGVFVCECPGHDLSDYQKFQLMSPSYIGRDSADQPMEWRYQYEFYRGVFAATGGGVAICPELLSATGRRSGRIDLFVPGKKWGIELIQEGSRLAEHDGRFGPSGAYGAWLSSNEMVDYILLDCRTSMLTKPHPRKISFLAVNRLSMADGTLQISEIYSMPYFKTDSRWSLYSTICYSKLKRHFSYWKFSGSTLQ
jgi:hypothetical protein